MLEKYATMDYVLIKDVIAFLDISAKIIYVSLLTLVEILFVLKVIRVKVENAGIFVIISTALLELFAKMDNVFRISQMVALYFLAIRGSNA